MADNTLHICVIAGEPSGDRLGGRLMKALKVQAQEQGLALEFSGVGGADMSAEGLQSLFSMEDLSVMGVAEIVPRLPLLIARINQTATHIIKTKPDILVTIDSPDFCFRVAKKVHDNTSDRPFMVHYVAPTVWAWREERAAKVASLYDAVLCLFPFEPPYFEKAGMKACFTGHSVVEDIDVTHSTKTQFLKERRLASNTNVLGLFFGSRMAELNRMGPLLRQALIEMPQPQARTVVVAPTLPHLEAQVTNLLYETPYRRFVITDPQEKQQAMGAMDSALATSGTIGLELAVAGVPHVIGYKMNKLTWRMIRNKLKVRYAHLGNILLDKPVVPEFIQDNCKPDSLSTAIAGLLIDEGTKQQKEAFADIRNLLAGSGKGSPSMQAASFILENCA